MRRVDKEKALEYLDKIEALTLGEKYINETELPEISTDALSLMVKVAQRKDGIKLLVERYAASHSITIVGALGFILTKKAENTKLKDAYLLFSAIERLNRRENPKVLGMPLTALKFQIGVAEIWQHTPMPESLYPFLQDCLQFSDERIGHINQEHSDDIKLDVIDVLRSICEHKIYNLNFNESQRKWIEDKIKEIAEANPDNKTFQRNTLYFFDCLNKQV